MPLVSQCSYVILWIIRIYSSSFQNDVQFLDSGVEHLQLSRFDQTTTCYEFPVVKAGGRGTPLSQIKTVLTEPGCIQLTLIK